MFENENHDSIDRLAGYSELIKRYNLEVSPNWHISKVATGGIHRIDSDVESVHEIYPPIYWPGDSLGDQLEFALKYDAPPLDRFLIH